jgi:hypothetical protein
MISNCIAGCSTTGDEAGGDFKAFMMRLAPTGVWIFYVTGNFMPKALLDEGN